MKKILLLLICVATVLSAQQTDSTIIFESPNKNLTLPTKTEMHDAWGIDILLSNNGFGAAGFYRREFDRELSGTMTFGIADSKDENEIEYVDYWGQTYSPGKINRFLLMPLMLGVQYRIFADDITDSFRPYINAGAGPTLILAAPYEKEWFSSWGYAHSYFTAGGYVGIGAFFGSDMGTLSGVNIRYYFVPVQGGIASMQGPTDYTDFANPKPGKVNKKKEFGGFFITINLGSMF